MKRLPTVLALLLATPSLSAAASLEPGDVDVQIQAVRAMTSVLRTSSAKTTSAMTSRRRRHVMGGGHLSSEKKAAAAETPDVSAYPVRGIDVSHFDGAVDWGTVGKDGFAFVYMKASEGQTVVDEEFAANWKGASAAGMLKGAYHFYDFCDDGASQADNFVRTVPVEAAALPPTIDLEKSADCAKMPARKDFRAELRAFLKTLSDRYGKKPILYMNDGIYEEYFAAGSDEENRDTYMLWIVDPDHRSPQFPSGPAWSIWQYDWHGKIAGVPGEVDYDVFSGTAQQLASLSTGAGRAAAAAP